MIECDIELDRQIDPDQLDVEWLNQSNLFYIHSDALDDKREEFNNQKLMTDRMKETLEYVKAKLELDIRKNPDEYDLEKSTDAAVKAAIYLQPEYQEAVENHFEAREELNRLQNELNRLYTNVNAMSEKRTAMERLVVMLNMQYFSTPNVPRNLSQEFQAYQKTRKTQKEAKQKIKDSKSKKKRRKDESS